MVRLIIKGFFLVLLAAVVLLSAAIYFSPKGGYPGPQKAGKPAILQKFEAAGGKIDFLGNAYGMDGWIITDEKDEKKVQFAYTSPQGMLLLGMMYAPDGTLETKRQLEAYAQRKSGSQAAAPGAENSQVKAEKFYAETEKANWVALGNSSAPYIYIYINVSCNHCQMFWEDLAGPVKDGKLQVRLVPFGKEEVNRDGGAALLSVENPEAAWRAYVDGDATALSKDKIKDGAYQKIDANMALAGTWNWNKGKPPFTLYRRPGDGAVTAIMGRPDNTLLLLAEFLK